MLKKSVFIFAALLCNGCSFLSNEKVFHFKNFSEIPQEEGISTWIPSFMPADATQISIYRNLDLGTVFGNYTSIVGLKLSNDLLQLNKESMPLSVKNIILRNTGLKFAEVQFFCSKYEQEVVISDLQNHVVFFYSDKMIENGFCEKHSGE